MRLSAAIRLGAMLRPQAFGAYMTSEGTCALGGALEAVGRIQEPDEAELPNWDEDAEQVWPWITDKQHRLRCPVCVVLTEPVEAMGVIIHLNDRHRWSREEIAAWVESVEPKEGAEDERKAEADDRRIPAGAPGVRDEACIGV